VAGVTAVGVAGAGTMGAGIAQLAAAAGLRAVLHDPVPEALERGVEEARAGVAKWVAKGRADSGAGERVQPAATLEELAGCELIIEAAPERLELKRELFARLGAIAPEAVLASNTSSIPITAIAGAAPDPSRVVGMHFFNPPPLMRLVEVIAAAQSSEAALAVARAVGEAMGKRVIDAADGPGFLVNRCSRPFGLEALRVVQDGIADVETVDRIVRGAGYRMGPFELQDLVGIDVGFAVSQSFHELSFGEPRWRPSPLSARMVAAGRLGRKTGRGWYRYDAGAPHRADDPLPPPGGGGDGRLVVVVGELWLAELLRGRALEAGFDVADEPGDEVPWLIVDCGHAAGELPLQGAPQALLVADSSLSQLDPGGGSAGFHALPPLPDTSVVELTRGSGTTAAAAERTEALFHAIGLATAWVGDAPGLVLGRIAAQLVNEAAFALQEGVTREASDVDDGMVLGLNHPFGPLAWGDEIGLDHVLMVLDGLRAELGEERYRAAPLLRRTFAEAGRFHPEPDG
jgi:3-hydroxybutyryl-CoA dehydrogenase